jgi:RimJ/RimL family protein N-acetyltransferase
VPGPAYRIETARLVVRAYDPRDAPLLKTALDASLDHLRPWMLWAYADPEPLAAKVSLLRRFRGRFDLDEDYVYAILDRDETRLVGGTGLHRRAGPEAREIGYWIAAAETGKGFATESTAALTRVAFEVDGVERVEIHVDAGNERSAAIPRRLGFTHEARLRGRLRDHDDRPRDEDLYALFADGLAGSPCAAAAVAAFDAAGARLL